MISKGIRNSGLGGQIFMVLIFIFLILPLFTYGQSCPTFKINRIEDTTNNLDNGSVEIDIKASKRYTRENFDIRQKENKITGALGYEVEFQIRNNSLVINGLKKSQDMYLSEYVILFSDKSCKNGELLEVGTFKIK